MSTARKSPIVDASGDNLIAVDGPGGVRYTSKQEWMGTVRNWEAGETNRLNQAHWSTAAVSGRPINDWLTEQLTIIRDRTVFETRNNGTLTGMVGTLANDVVGPDGPTLEVQSSDERYNTAAEKAWRDWFRAPTFRSNYSGASLLRSWVKPLPTCGEFLAQVDTDPTADSQVKMRLRRKHPRDLASPLDASGDPRIVLGVEFETAELDRPSRYWINKATADGFREEVEPWPADLVIHGFIDDEAKQARGYPWIISSLTPAADLRDYDDNVQDAAVSMAENSTLLFNTNSEDPQLTPEGTTYERRTIKMAPPGWQPFNIGAGQPPVQYPDYRSERQREIFAPMSMPLMIGRNDASNHNYSSARFDGQGWARFIQWLQNWIGGTERSVGPLTRLVKIVLAEARFDDSALRITPPDVVITFTWPVRPHVDRLKEASGAEKELLMGTQSLTGLLAESGKTLDKHIQTCKSEREKLVAAGLPLPAWMRGETAGEIATLDDEDENGDAIVVAKKKEPSSG
jgi:capsid protein